MARTKILVIKLGYSETLDPKIGVVPSLGDVVRTTAILPALKERFPDSQITWLVAHEAKFFLQDSSYVDRVLEWDSFVPFQLMREKFDVLINLEKIPGICGLADMIEAWTKYGFRFDTETGRYEGYERGLEFMSYLAGKGDSAKALCWQQAMIEMLGVPWRGQEYALGYQPDVPLRFDVGFNYKVGSKWPAKAMSIGKWKELEALLHQEGLTVSWQEGFDNLQVYMDWVASNRVIVSCDSLGIHLALAQRRRIVGLFGPTDEREVYLYGRGRIVRPRGHCELSPCMDWKCHPRNSCMEDIALDDIMQAVRQSLATENRALQRQSGLMVEKEVSLPLAAVAAESTSCGLSSENLK